MQKKTGVSGIAPLQNVVNFDSLVRRLQNSKSNLPRIGVMFGRSGRGKTFAATFAANEHNAHHVQVGFSWTQRYFCKAVMVELGLIKPNQIIKASIPEMVAKIAEELAKDNKLLFIDDSQYLERKGMLELVLDIYEASRSPLILLGEENLPNLISKLERLHNRVLAWVEAKECNLADCKALARIICQYERIEGKTKKTVQVDVATDLLEKLCTAVEGCARRIATNLDHIREFATARSLTSINAAAYTEKFDTGDHRSV